MKLTTLKDGLTWYGLLLLEAEKFKVTPAGREQARTRLKVIMTLLSGQYEPWLMGQLDSHVAEFGSDYVDEGHERSVAEGLAVDLVHAFQDTGPEAD